MTEGYTASNGITIHRLERGYGFANVPDSQHIIGSDAAGSGDSRYGISDAKADALREMFRAEDDKQLGRWRSLQNPSWTAVVQEDSGMILFRHEAGQRQFDVLSRRDLNRWTPELQAIAREYFDAHPEPKPWQSAKRGDVWALKAGLGPNPAVFDGLAWAWVTTGAPVPLHLVTEAERIWPRPCTGEQESA